MNFKKAAMWTTFWVVLALSFAIGVLHFQGESKALEFLAAYLIELSLSVDNLFLFLTLFSAYKISPAYQQRILNWGIIGAMVMRLIFILFGISLVQKFHWLLYIFGVILIITGFKMAFGKEKETDPSDNFIMKLLKKFIPVTSELHNNQFFAKINGVLHATPLFVVLLLIESTDLLFAVDSIPAVFSITTDPFIVYSSNVLAIFGLRSMYFFLERMQQAFVYVKYGIALLLSVTGLKMLLAIWHIKVSMPISLGVIAIILFGSILSSIIFGKQRDTIS